MQVLVVGGGGREHALCWKLAQSPLVKKLYVAPGNAGCAAVAERVAIQPTQIDVLTDFVHSRKIDLTVVGPEAALVGGLVDRLTKLGLKAFGPTKDAARLEGSKGYAKALARTHNIPSPDFRVFQSLPSALAYLERAAHYPLVIKADGLAAGKGVRVCHDEAEAKEHLLDCLERGRFGEAGARVVVEDFVKGNEASVLVVTCGKTLLVLEPARDYKTALDGDRGPNTGGMGAVSPAPLPPETMTRIEEKILIPTIHAMAREGHPFKGVLYAGLMLTQAGPRLLEYNVRFGDPEAQPTLARLKSDLVPILLGAVDGTLDRVQAEWDERKAVCVVLTSGGYPGEFKRGFAIHGLEAAAEDPDVRIFHAGTERKGERIVTDGGRVLNVVGLGATVAQARERAYAAVKKIHFEGMHYRADIGAGM
ncbi:MAG: phosphoribosylamine--glycine ligase [Planctomycetes bacterium]|nr:phosphoribosylamine--glycine ligase [Planctomycetota bacterium]